ncbi:hypothetical protein ACFLYE_04470, partial [Chloroflexota bacterium]
MEKKTLSVINAPALPGFPHESEFQSASSKIRADKLSGILPGTYPYDARKTAERVRQNTGQETLSTIHVLATALYFKHHYTYRHS